MTAIQYDQHPVRGEHMSGRIAQRMRESTTHRADDDLFMRRRVSLYFQVLFFIQCAFMICCEILTLLGMNEPVSPELEQLLTGLNLGLPSALAIGWQATRHGRMSSSTLRVLETIGTVVLCCAYARVAMLGDAPEGRMSGLMLVCMILVLRASLIPSPMWRTLLVGISAVVATGWIHEHHGGVVFLQHAGTVILGGAFVAISGVTSFVIYGLRREVTAARQLGPYQLDRKLGAGGMGVVYAATHLLLRRPTAIKLLPIDSMGEENLARFEREVHQTSRLEHPNSINIYDYGRTPDGQFYYAMEYLDGLNLDELVDQTGALSPSRTVHLLTQAADALAEAHAIGLVHRDIKPANMMVCHRGGVPDVVKVLDFGLVKELARDMGETQRDKIIGTPQFLAPEAITQADASSPATDVYALGAVAYYLLTGRHVFEATTVIEVCAMHLSERPAPPSRYAPATLDARLEAIVLRCLAKDPSERFADAAELAAALRAVQVPAWSAQAANQWWGEQPSVSLVDAA